MRTLALSIAVVVVGCGGAPGKITPPPVIAPPPPPGYEVARSMNFGAVATDATHVYWVDGGLHRRAHGGATPAERLFVTENWIDRMAIGTSDVFFIDDGYRLRALPKTGGAPSELAGLEDVSWGLAADGDGAWVGTGTQLQRWSREPDERKLTLPGYGVALAVAGGEAFVAVRDAEATLYRIDLASGKATPLSDAWYFTETLGLGVSGSSLVAALRDGVVTLPRAGGKPRQALPMYVYAIAVDDTGFAASTDTAVVSQTRGAPPRVIASSNAEWTTSATPTVAVAGPYVYHLAYANLDGAMILRGEPRAVGPTMLRVPPDLSITALAADGGRALIGGSGGDGDQLLALTAAGSKRLSGAPGGIEGIVVEAGEVAFAVGGMLYRVEGGAPVERAEITYPPLALHRGTVFWSDGLAVHGIKLAGSAPSFVVHDVGPDFQGDSVGQDPGLALQFSGDHLYFVQQVLDVPALVRVDEHRQSQTLWKHPGGEGFLDASLAVIGDAAYVHDGLHVYQVPLDGSAARTIHDAPDFAVQRVYRAGEHLVAWLRPADGTDQLVELPLAGGTPKVLWSGYLAGNPQQTIAAGDGVLFVHAPELGALLRIELD